MEETSAEVQSNAAAADSALQQVLNLNQESATNAEEVAEDVVDQAETAAEEIQAEAEEVVNPQ